MLDWPMSSPQMMTMLGFRGCWAVAGALATVAEGATLPDRANVPGRNHGLIPYGSERLDRFGNWLSILISVKLALTSGEMRP